MGKSLRSRIDGITRHRFNKETGIKKIEHDGYTLRITYVTGKTFDYQDVSDHLVSSLMKNERPMYFMLHFIKPGRDSLKVRPSDPFPSVAWN